MMFGKNIIITDNTDWLTGDIIEANLARWQVEDRCRLSKDDELVGTSSVCEQSIYSKTVAETGMNG